MQVIGWHHRSSDQQRSTICKREQLVKKKTRKRLRARYIENRLFLLVKSNNAPYFYNRAFSHDVTAAMLVFQNKEMPAMMVYQTNPPGIELYFYANTFFCFSNPIDLIHDGRNVGFAIIMQISYSHLRGQTTQVREVITNILAT